MAKKKKDSEAIPSFDAMAASRRWRRQTSAQLNQMTLEQQIAFLNRRAENWPAARTARTARTSAHR